MFVNLDVEAGHRFQFFTSTVNPENNTPVYNPPAGDGYFTLRSMQPYFEAQGAKRKKVREFVFNPKTRAMDCVTYLPELSEKENNEQMEGAWDYAIISFEGFNDKKTGAVIECNPQTKVSMSKVPVISRFLSRCFQIIDEESVSVEANLTKNSSALPSGHRASEGKAAKIAD